MDKKPFISVIVPTYNRARTLGRTVDSVLRQTFTDFEIIIVDDGSTDNTMELLKNYTDNRIRIIRHDKNKGVTAAKNTGLNHIRGEWFCTLDSDNEILPETFEEMLHMPLHVDQKIDWVVTNCVDSVSGKFTGLLLDRDQYLDMETRMKAEGEFWGILKTSLLGEERFNEKLPGYENTLWYKLYEKAYRYYLHKGYQIYHTEGDDRITVSTKNLKSWNTIYEEFSKETAFLRVSKKYKMNTYARRCLLGVIFCKASGNMNTFRFWMKELQNLEGYRKHKFIAFAAGMLPSGVISISYNSFCSVVKRIKSF